MKNWGKGIIAIIVIAAIVAFVVTRERRRSEFHFPLASIPSHKGALPENYHTPYQQMPDARRAALDKVFEAKLKPALAKWCKAYSGRVPFKPEDVTPDKFHNVEGNDLYTFMVGTTTLTIADDGDSAHVVYMMTKDGAKKLNSIPHDGQAPDVSVPVTTAQVLEMVKEDRGVSFTPDKVRILPSGAASALGGGAFVHVNETLYNGAEVVTGKDFLMVFGKDGNLVDYEGPMF